MSMRTNIFVNEDKYICQLGELYFVIFTKICTKTILCVKMVGAMSLDSQYTLHSKKKKVFIFVCIKDLFVCVTDIFVRVPVIIR